MRARGLGPRLGIALTGSFAILLGLWAARAPGLTGAALCLSPGLVVFLLLWLGRYPGEKAILALIGRPRRRRSRSSIQAPHRRPVVRLPRGGALLAASLAGRAPPSGAGPPTTGTSRLSLISVCERSIAGVIGLDGQL